MNSKRHTQVIVNLGLLMVLSAMGSVAAELIFEENFDGQPDWTSGLPENDRGGLKVSSGTVDITQRSETHTIPVGWDVVRQAPKWAPSTGHPDRHEVIEILESNSHKARGGQGKSFVSWRDSNISDGANYWNSDGVLARKIPPTDELYVEFWITFSNEMIATYYSPEYKDDSTGSGKFFRVYHDDPTTGEFHFFGGNNNPHFVWGHSGRPAANNGYGFRNNLSFLTRRANLSEGYFLRNGTPTTSEPSSYRTDTLESFGGSALIDRKNGGYISKTGVVDIDQVFGDEQHWTKIGFYLKMNSAPGVFDGIFIQWVDDTKVIEINTMNWVESARDMVQWNTVALGGNDWFNKYPDEQRVEEWYAIDDFKVFSKIPEELVGHKPMPPANFTIDSLD